MSLFLLSQSTIPANSPHALVLYQLNSGSNFKSKKLIIFGFEKKKY